MKIVCFGDSNTWGYDPRGPFGGRYDSPWPALLAQKTGDIVSNQGENGREIPGRPPVFAPDTDCLIVMLGTNDLLQGASPEAVCARMERFLQALPMGRERLLLIAPPSMRPGLWVPDRRLIDGSEALARGYRGLSARLGIRFLDAGQWDIPLAFDGVHFTGDGHASFAEHLHRGLGDPHP